VRSGGVSPGKLQLKFVIVKVIDRALDMSTYHRPDAKFIQSLKDVANKLRIHSINSTNASNSG